MPKVTPTWMIICWAAPATPRSASSTAWATVDAIAGFERPMATPARARPPTMTRGAVPSRIVAIHSIDSTMSPPPSMPVTRSPVRATTRPARGPAMAKAIGRAVDTSPVRVSSKPSTFCIMSGVRMKLPM